MPLRAPKPARQRRLSRKSSRSVELRPGGFGERATPIVKWAGGKTRLLPTLLEYVPFRYRNYYEPFLGGGALFFRLAPTSAVIGDKNADIIGMYRTITSDVEAVIAELGDLRARHSTAHYYEIRERWNKGGQPSAERAAMLIYLNRTCYNGLWRVNRKGKFNVPVGRYEAPAFPDAAHLRLAARALRRAELVAGDYRETVAGAGAGDLVYLDPPYHPTSATAKFTSYTAEAFGEADHVALADLATDLAERGCTVLVSNSDTPLVRKLYEGWNQARCHVGSAISSLAQRRGERPELVLQKTAVDRVAAEGRRGSRG